MSIQNCENPLVTYAVLFYNQENLAEIAMRAALAQDYSPLEIIVSDDCSNDNTWSIVEKIAASYDGPHRLQIIKNESNMGIGPHVGKIGLVAEGQLIVLADGDDVSYPHRVSRLVEKWRSNNFASGALHSAVVRREPGGTREVVVESPAADPLKASMDFFVKNHFRGILNGASIAYTKNLFEEFPPIKAPFEDILLTLRALLIGKLMYVNEPLLDYYLAEGSVSRPLKRKDRIRIIAWFDTIEKNIECMRCDYLYYIDKTSSVANKKILCEFSNVKKKCRQAAWLASSNIIKLIKGMIAYPYDMPIKQKIGFYLVFFGLIK